MWRKKREKEKTTPVLSATQSRITSKKKKEMQDWSVRVPWSELLSRAIIRSINRAEYIF